MDRKKEKAINHYKKCLTSMITDLDFQRYFGPEVKNNIMKYSELENYSDINELLPNDKDFKVILTESKRNEGHWCCLSKYKNKIEWFDSYAEHPDGQLSFIPKVVKKMLGQNKNYLTKLLKTARDDQEIVYNNDKLQVLDDEIATCGRWCIARLLTMRLGYTLPEFLDLVKRKSTETGKPPDILICDWIN
jgi:hypothetical protein